MSKTLHVNVLSKQSINMAIRRLNEYKKEVETKTIVLAQKLTDLGADIVRMKIVEMGAVDKGDLLSSVGGYFSPTFNMGVIQVTSEHAAFVEFGTGVALGNTLHPNAEYLAKASWNYGVGEHIFTTKDGKIGWIYPTDDGEFRFTEGMSSRPFMYETALELDRQFEQIAREVFA